jgi:U6 snRNA-associated Sm-like protein LSm1
MREDLITGSRENEVFLDKKTVVLLRDGTYFYGTFRSFDQFNNITLEDTVERVFFENMFSDKKVGLYVIRGESIVLVGVPRSDLSSLKRVPWNIIQEKIAAQQPSDK